jgi:hypothetical protein
MGGSELEAVLGLEFVVDIASPEQEVESGPPLRATVPNRKNGFHLIPEEIGAPRMHRCGLVAARGRTDMRGDQRRPSVTHVP